MSFQWRDFKLSAVRAKFFRGVTENVNAMRNTKMKVKIAGLPNDIDEVMF